MVNVSERGRLLDLAKSRKSKPDESVPGDAIFKMMTLETYD
jgi:hypothetical protein